jgi:multiple sugar transport system permease protein
MKSAKKKFEEIAYKTFSHFFIILFGIMMLYPVVWLVSSSFKEGNLIFSDPGIIPKAVTFDHYVKGWAGIGNIHFSQFFRNSILVCVIAVCGTVGSSIMAAYAFARLKFPFRSFWFAVMMITVMLPGHVTTIPRYVMFHGFHWIDTYLPLLVPCFLATNAFFIFLMNQFIRSLPKDLDESATIDGCSKAGIFLKIIIPLSTPALVTTALFTFLWTWDDFFHQLLYLNTVGKYTVPLGLRLFMDSTGQSNWGAMFAMSFLSITPCFILFFALQKYFVQGITTTGIKG